MKALFGLRRQSEVTTTLWHMARYTHGHSERCRALLATAVQIAWLVVTILFSSQALAQTNAPGDSTVRFRSVDIYVDSKDKPIAAYQIEFCVKNDNAKIVGIEGGEHPAFSEPPFYDLKAMQYERVIIAAFTTEAADKLPKRKTRVARIHVQTSRMAEMEFELKLQITADSEGNKLLAEASAEER